MTTPTGILLGNAVASGDFGDDSPLANIWETILAIEAEAAPAPLDGLREAAQAFVEVNDRGGLGLEYDVAWEDALDRIRAALRDEGETT